jgi:hypothetical protein
MGEIHFAVSVCDVMRSVIRVGTTNDEDFLQVTCKEGYFHNECGGINVPFDKQLWAHIQFICHYHNMHFIFMCSG